jgi:hypothetical protein
MRCKRWRNMEDGGEGDRRVVVRLLRCGCTSPIICVADGSHHPRAFDLSGSRRNMDSDTKDPPRGNGNWQVQVERDLTRANNIQKMYASVGNRTRANCLEGNYDTISPRKLDIKANKIKYNSNSACQLHQLSSMKDLSTSAQQRQSL